VTSKTGKPIDADYGRRAFGPLYDELYDGATAVVSRTKNVDWSEVGIMLVHKSSPAFAASIANGGQAPGPGDIAIQVVTRAALAEYGVAYENEIPVMLAANDVCVVVGIARPS
jgi:hypothetical protein